MEDRGHYTIIATAEDRSHPGIIDVKRPFEGEENNDGNATPIVINCFAEYEKGPARNYQRGPERPRDSIQQRFVRAEEDSHVAARARCDPGVRHRKPDSDGWSFVEPWSRRRRGLRDE